jgi:hypothetical protein
LTSASPIPSPPFDRSIVVLPCSKMLKRRGIRSALMLYDEAVHQALIVLWESADRFAASI